MKKYTIAILGIIFNVMLITGLIVYAFTTKENNKYIERQYIYIEETKVKENNTNDNTNDNTNNDTNDNTNDNTNNDTSITTKKVIIKNNANNSNANNSNANNSNSNSNNSNANNSNDNNKNYTVDYTNTNYCGFCGIELNNNTGICENCKNLRAKLGE